MRHRIRRALKDQGFTLAESGEISNGSATKEEIRRYHEHGRLHILKRNLPFLQKSVIRLGKYFADGCDVNVKDFDPVVLPIVPETEYWELFKFATHLWSVPVSQGFGRRSRFLVLDRSNGKLVGIFALCDPVFNLSARDKWIGWKSEDRRCRLYHVMDLFILGAVPPYSNLLGSKLIALLAASDEVRKYIERKYSTRQTVIQGERKRPNLVLLTTTSALGRSSIYNRITLDDRKVFVRIGETAGWGHFHLANGTFSLMRDYLTGINDPVVCRNRFGQGPNWKIRVVRTCLEHIGLSPDLLQHGIKREVYAAPLAENFKEVLNGNAIRPRYLSLTSSEIVSFFKQRWMEPRAVRNPTFRQIESKMTVASIVAGTI
jgi:hypothetical protein